MSCLDYMFSRHEFYPQHFTEQWPHAFSMRASVCYRARFLKSVPSKPSSHAQINKGFGTPLMIENWANLDQLSIGNWSCDTPTCWWCFIIATISHHNKHRNKQDRKRKRQDWGGTVKSKRHGVTWCFCLTSPLCASNTKRPLHVSFRKQERIWTKTCNV